MLLVKHLLIYISCDSNITIKNNEREALKKFYELGKKEPAVMLGQYMFKVINGTTFSFDEYKIDAVVDAILLLVLSIRFADEQLILHKN